MQVNGNFTGNGTSASALIGNNTLEASHHFNLSLSGLTGTGATVTLRRSFDAGTTWKTIQAYTADIEYIGYEPGRDVLYQLVCSNYTTGTIIYGLG